MNDLRYTVTSLRGRGQLLFQTLDSHAVAEIPALTKIFGDRYFVSPVSRKGVRSYYYGWGSVRDTSSPKPPFGILVTHEQPPIIPYPDEVRTADQAIILCQKGTLHTVNFRTRYNNCLSLFKAVGCSSCPDHGLVCLSQDLDDGGIALAASTSDPDEEELLSLAISQYKTLGRFAFVHPGQTRVKPFTPALRAYWEHDFDRIEQNNEERSSAATKAASGRRFKKNECGRCVLSPACTAYRSCSGAYPPEAEIIEHCNNQLTEAIKKSEFPEWQLWALARGAGETSKHSRYQLVLTGVTLRSSKLVPTVHRAKTNIQEYHNLKTYEEIAECFTLARREEDVKPVTDPLIRAIWWLSMQQHRYARAKGGWGSTRSCIGVGVSETGVHTTWTNGRHILSWYGQTLRTLSEFAARLSPGRLPGIVQLPPATE